MTWRTEIGERTLAGAEAALIRMKLHHVVTIIDEVLEGHLKGWQFGVRLFDSLNSRSQLALLAEVGAGLLRETVVCPELNALNEATIAVLFRSMEDGIEIELECQDKMSDPTCLRRAILAAVQEAGDLEGLPEADCNDFEEWKILVDVLEERILWGADFENADQFLDAAPERAAFLRAELSIDADYFRAIPPDPLESEIPALMAKLNALSDG